VVNKNITPEVSGVLYDRIWGASSVLRQESLIPHLNANFVGGRDNVLFTLHVIFIIRRDDVISII